MNSKERTEKAKLEVLEAKEKALDDKWAKEKFINQQKFQLAQNCYVLKFFEEQIRDKEVKIKDDKIIGPVPMEFVVKNAYGLRSAIDDGIFNLKKAGLTDDEIATELENNKAQKYEYLMV